MIDKTVFAMLSRIPEVTREVGTRIFPVFLPEKNPLPAVVFRRVSTTGAISTHSGTSGKVTSEFEVECYGKDITIVKNLAKAVRRTFSGFSGSVGGNTVHRAWVDNEFDDYDFESGTYTIPLEVYLTHDEA